jgi:hypothetical protein
MSNIQLEVAKRVVESKPVEVQAAPAPPPPPIS